MEMKRIPGLVSVVITNYNRSEYIRECLNSISKQTYQQWEIIFIDDASTDESVEVAQQWLEQNRAFFAQGNQVIIHSLPRNTGFAGALNTGLYLAQGEFIAIQDSDDYSHVLRFQKQVEFLKVHAEIDLVGTTYYAFYPENPDKKIRASWIKYGDDIRKIYWDGGHCVCHGTIMFRGSLFDQIGGPTRRIVGAEDYEFIAKVLNAKAKIDNIPEALYYYRSHPKQRSVHYYKRKEDKP